MLEYRPDRLALNQICSLGLTRLFSSINVQLEVSQNAYLDLEGSFVILKPSALRL